MLESYAHVVQAGTWLAVLGGAAGLFYWGLGRLHARAQSAGKHLLEALFGAMRIPGLLAFALAALHVLPPTQALTPHLGAVLLVIIFTLFLVSFAGRFKQALLRRHGAMNARIRSTLDIGTRAVQLAALALAMLISLSIYGIDITGLIALGGIGGIIVGSGRQGRPGKHSRRPDHLPR